MARRSAVMVLVAVVMFACAGSSSRRTEEPATGEQTTTTTFSYDECYLLAQDEQSYHAATEPAEEGWSDGYDDAITGEQYQQSYDPDTDLWESLPRDLDDSEACLTGFADGWEDGYTEAYDAGWEEGHNPDPVHFCEIVPSSPRCR